MTGRSAFAFVILPGLSACAGVDPTLGVAPSSAPAAPAAAVDVTLAPPPVAAAPAGALAVAFAPVTGVAAAQAAELSAGLNAGAAAKGVALLAAGDPSARFLVKGYLAALAESGKTSVVFVFDILDPSGARLHRIQGAEAAPGASADAWAAVPPATMRRIADRLLADMASWAAARAG